MSGVQTVVGRLVAAQDETRLRALVMGHAGEVVPVGVVGLYLLEPDGRPSSVDVRGLPESVVQRYEEIGRGLDPLLGAIAAEHTTVSAVDLLGERGWHTSALYDHVAGPADIEHYVVAPLLGEGRIVGTVNFVRLSAEAPFTPREVARASALGHHLSALLARLRARPADSLPLTERDREIVALVARGRTNAEIGAALHISPNTVKQTLKRIFARTGVRSRAELAARAGQTIR